VTTSGFNPKTRRSLGALIGEVPSQVADLVRAEVDAFKAELSNKAKNLGVGVGMFAAAAFFGFFAFAVLVALAIIALALVLPLWLATLIVAVLLLVIAGILALVGLKRVKKATATDPDGVRASIRQDVDALRGVGQYE
jgi:uncharacterized membrane protein YqjE